MKITIELDEKETTVLNKRANHNLFNLKEQIEDIIRRSVISSEKRKTSMPLPVDDKLVGIFSRQRSGRRKKAKEMNKIKKRKKK